MDAWLLIARVLLAGVFATAGMAKLWDRAGFHRAVVDFGVPVRVAHRIGDLLPIAELTVAALLIPARFAFWSGLAALVLLCVFIAAIAANLASGRMPTCRCFGEVSARPIGPRTLVRNGLLALCAAAVVWSGRGNAAPSLVATVVRFDPMVIGAAVAAAAFAAQTWLVLHLLRQHGRLLLRIDVLETRVGLESAVVPANQGMTVELEIGALAPVFHVRSSAGETVSLTALWSGLQPALLIFSNPECGPCAALMPRVAAWQVEHASRLRIAVITTGSIEDAARQRHENGLRDIFLQRDTEVSDGYGAYGTPAGVLIDANGAIASRVALGADAIAELVGGAGSPEPSATAVSRTLDAASLSVGAM